MQNRRPVLFDAIEFNDEFAKIDVMYDLAFLLMDLEFRGLKPLANAVLNRYLDRSGDIEALTCLPLFMSLRAAIRSHVSATMSASIEGHEKHRLVSAARRYLDLAIDYLTICRPRLIAIGGLSGTGKSRLARIMAPAIGPSPGAVVIRSDVLRKRLGGVELHKKLGEDGYNPEMTQRTYTDMMECAAKALNAGHTVIADAVFADPAERDAIQNVARNANMKFDGIWLEADQKTLEQRVANRKANVSDATVAVVRQQQNYDLGEVDWMKVNTSGPRKEVVRNARLIL